MDAELLSDSEKEYYSNFESLFLHPGWRQLKAELHAEVESLPEHTFWGAADMNQLLAARMRCTVIQEMLHYDEIIEQRKQDAVHLATEVRSELIESQRPDL